VSPQCVRVLFNREVVGVDVQGGFEFDNPNNCRDILCSGDIQEGIREFVRVLGWEKELNEHVETAKL
jgi:hypothetical protein